MVDIYGAPASDVEKPAERKLYAGFWIRLLATFIDYLWLLPLTWALGYFYYGSGYFNTDSLALGAVDIFLQHVLPAILVLGFWKYKAATPGKMAVKMRIADARTFEPASSKQLIIRYLGYIPAMLILMLGIIWIAFDDRKQGWHDKIANTVVLYR